MHHVEGVEDDAVGTPPHGGAECLEVGNTVTILHNGLTIDYCRFAGEVGGGSYERWIAVAPIVSITGEYAGLSSLDHDLAAIAIMLDFVNPVFALWRLIDGGIKRNTRICTKPAKNCES
jgi:hypothetical protein